MNEPEREFAGRSLRNDAANRDCSILSGGLGFRSETVVWCIAARCPAVGSIAAGIHAFFPEGTPLAKGYRGKVGVLYFYPKDFTGGLHMRRTNFQRDQAAVRSKGRCSPGV